MAKYISEENEYRDKFDDGTYQTGAIRPPKPSSGLVAILLAAVIILGGICSALGLLNIRLLQKLAQMNQETTPISMDSQPLQPTKIPFLDDLEGEEPQVPSVDNLSLQIVRSPYYSAPQNTDAILTAEQVYHKNTDAMVQVQCLTHFGATQTGVGLIIDSDGFILVNYHVVDAARRIFVTLSDGSMHRAALVGSDSFSDLAVLYIQVSDLSSATFSSNQSLQITDPTFAVSALNQMEESSIFSVSRTFSTKSNTLTLVQTCKGGDAGPVFDSFGHVIGFQVGHISQYFPSADTKGIGLVIPTQAIVSIVSDLVQQGHINGRPSLGIQVEAISKVYQQYWQLPVGLLLTGVEQNSDAALNGLQEGDILMALNGNPITTRSDLYTTLHNLQIGDTVIAVVCRNNQKFTVKLTIEDNSQR